MPPRGSESEGKRQLAARNKKKRDRDNGDDGDDNDGGESKAVATTTIPKKKAARNRRVVPHPKKKKARAQSPSALEMAELNYDYKLQAELDRMNTSTEVDAKVISSSDGSWPTHSMTMHGSNRTKPEPIDYRISVYFANKPGVEFRDFAYDLHDVLPERWAVKFNKYKEKKYGYHKPIFKSTSEVKPSDELKHKTLVRIKEWHNRTMGTDCDASKYYSGRPLLWWFLYRTSLAIRSPETISDDDITRMVLWHEVEDWIIENKVPYGAEYIHVSDSALYRHQSRDERLKYQHKYPRMTRPVSITVAGMYKYNQIISGINEAISKAGLPQVLMCIIDEYYVEPICDYCFDQTSEMFVCYRCNTHVCCGTMDDTWCDMCHRHGGCCRCTDICSRTDLNRSDGCTIRYTRSERIGDNGNMKCCDACDECCQHSKCGQCSVPFSKTITHCKSCSLCKECCSQSACARCYEVNCIKPWGGKEPYTRHDIARCMKCNNHCACRFPIPNTIKNTIAFIPLGIRKVELLSAPAPKPTRVVP